MRILPTLIGSLLMLAFAAPASANTIYQYQGNPFAYYNSPFGVTDRVTRFLSFAAAARRRRAAA